MIAPTLSNFTGAIAYQFLNLAAERILKMIAIQTLPPHPKEIRIRFAQLLRLVRLLGRDSLRYLWRFVYVQIGTFAPSRNALVSRIADLSALRSSKNSKPFIEYF